MFRVKNSRYISIVRLHLLALLVLVLQINAFARPVDLSIPMDQFDSITSQGYVRVWREIYDVDFGRDLKLPLRFRFSSDSQISSPYLGRGWGCPLLESSAVPFSNYAYKVTLLCGKVMFLSRKTTSDTVYFTSDKEWQGKLDNNIFTVSRDDGWKLVFIDGQVHQLTTDTKREINWIYQNGVCTALNERGGAPVLETKFESGTLTRIVVNGKSILTSQDRRPRVQNAGAGIRVVGGIDKALCSCAWPNGIKETYQFSVDKDVYPQIEISSTSTANPGSKILTWDPETYQVRFDGTWTYTCSKLETPSSLAAITRKNSQGKKEYYYYDRAAGTETTEDILGTRTVTYRFVGMGPLRGKTRRIDVSKQGGAITTIYQPFYNEKGQLLKAVDLNKGTVNYKYSTYAGETNPRIISEVHEKDGVIVSERHFDHMSRLTEDYNEGILRFKTFYSDAGAWPQEIGDVIAQVGKFIDIKALDKVQYQFGAIRRGRPQKMGRFYDAQGTLIAFMHFNGNIETYESNESRKETYTKVNGKKVSARQRVSDLEQKETYFNDAGNIVEEKTYTIDPVKRESVTRVTGSLGSNYTITQKYDAKDRVIESVDSYGNSYRYTYTNDGTRNEKQVSTSNIR